MPELNTTVENTENSQTLCELELWRPPQGTISEAIPLSIDLDFDAETVQLPTTSFSVRTRRATVHLGMTDADLVRGSVFWKKRRSKKAEHDHIVKSSMRVSRVIPRTGGKWAVVEPVAPHVLSGRYVGSDGEKEVGPLCLLTMRGEACLVQVIVTVNRQDLNIEQNNAGAQHSRNMVAVLDEMARRAIASNQVTNFALPPYIGPEDIVLSKSSMEVTVEDE